MTDHDGQLPDAPERESGDGLSTVARVGDGTRRRTSPETDVESAGPTEHPSKPKRVSRLRLQINLWRHRLLHPVSTLRYTASRLLPFRVRASLLRAAGRGRRTAATAAEHREAFFRQASPVPRTEKRARPTIVCLPLVEWSLRVQRPHHLLVRLADRGWPVLYASLELGAGNDRIVVDPAPVANGIHLFTIPATRRSRVGEQALRNEEVAGMLEAFADLRRDQRIHEAVVLCHSPFWRPLARLLKKELGWPVVYDRMDLHQGFSTTSGSVADEERSLLAEADLVTATADVLARVENGACKNVLRLPNACDPGHWNGATPSEELQAMRGPVIGYFGAISEWCDTALVAEIARARPKWSFVLIGSTWGADISRLEVLPNVHLLGERPYDELPALASTFDVGIIPFKRTPLTEATDPVKLYEMMALGLEVVAPPLPELVRHGNIIRLAEGAEGFLEAIENALRAAPGVESAEHRREFARANNWESRTDTLEAALCGLFPMVTIGIVTFNNRELTELCLDSINEATVHPNVEVVVVDNASEDGTQEWLAERAVGNTDLRIVLNRSNRGFAAACNQAFANAAGSVLCLLNNDTIVTRGWLSTMVQALDSSPEVGLVGPCSNGVANEARVEPGYEDLAGLAKWVGDFVWRSDGEEFPIPMLALYCAALRREVWQEVGGLDERFEVGLFEDDDFSRRIRRAGYDLRCLRGAWVHHFQEASFGALPREEYARIYEANRKRFREKWKDPGGTNGEALEASANGSKTDERTGNDVR